jgi:phosphotransferase system enzyme I (PtsI)
MPISGGREGPDGVLCTGSTVRASIPEENRRMQLSGYGIGHGSASGPVRIMPGPLPEPGDEPRTADAATEFSAVVAALDAVALDLTTRGERAGGPAKDVLAATALMATDPSVIADLHARIDSGSTGERAVFDAFALVQATLTDLGGYVAERASDVADVAQRAIARLRGVPAPGVPDSGTPYVLIARDLAPADTATLDLDLVLALITAEGGPTGHTAILARSRGIPALIGVEGALDVAEGTVVLVDAASGTLLVDPGDDALAAARSSRAVPVAPLANGTLADGTRIPLLANLGSPEEVARAIGLGAEGVGLLRTEFLFLDATTPPTVAEQSDRYAAVLRHFPGRRVVVRVLDAGADKPLPFLHGGREDNPALGLRGLRALRANEGILRDQLTALAVAQAETGADLWVMAPMVADLEETSYFVGLAREFGLGTVGVMAEVPSLALQAEQVVRDVDFVSIGTNDLTQYTMAADRTLASVARYQDAWHPAVLRLVGMIGGAGAAHGTPVGVCGEAAADPALAVVLVGLGATSLSMAPEALAAVRAELATVTLAQARERAARALTATSAAGARAAAAAS